MIQINLRFYIHFLFINYAQMHFVLLLEYCSIGPNNVPLEFQGHQQVFHLICRYGIMKLDQTKSTKMSQMPTSLAQ